MTATLQIKKDRPNYYALICYQDEATGKERQKWVTTDISAKGSNKRKAEARLREVLAEYEVQKIDLSKDVFFAESIKHWLENHKHSIAETTYDSYSIALKTHIIPFFEPKKIRVRDLTPMHIQQYIKDIQTTMDIYLELDMSAKNNIADKLDEKFSRFII